MRAEEGERGDLLGLTGPLRTSPPPPSPLAIPIDPPLMVPPILPPLPAGITRIIAKMWAGPMAPPLGLHKAAPPGNAQKCNFYGFECTQTRRSYIISVIM